MIARRRWTKPTRSDGPRQAPSPSGPRCRMRWLIAASSPLEPGHGASVQVVDAGNPAHRAYVLPVPADRLRMRWIEGRRPRRASAARTAGRTRCRTLTHSHDGRSRRDSQAIRARRPRPLTARVRPSASPSISSTSDEYSNSAGGDHVNIGPIGQPASEGIVGHGRQDIRQVRQVLPEREVMRPRLQDPVVVPVDEHLGRPGRAGLQVARRDREESEGAFEAGKASRLDLLVGRGWMRGDIRERPLAKATVAIDHARPAFDADRPPRPEEQPKPGIADEGVLLADGDVGAEAVRPCPRARRRRQSCP